MNEVKLIGDEFYGETANPFRALKHLRFEKMPNGKIGCHGVVSLEEQGLPCNLQYWEVNGCYNLEKLPNALHTLTSLTDLLIHNCPKLLSFPETGLPPMLRRLGVRNCRVLETLPDGMMMNSCILDNNTCRLEWLHVWGCPSLKSIPRGCFPPHLRYFPFGTASNWSRFQGICCKNLTSLQLLNIYCENMRWPPSGWGLNILTSLGELFIQGPFRDLLSFSGSHLLLPTSLTTLRLGNLRNLKSIASTSLQSLISLKTLEFHICPKLWSFVPNEGLPATLARLVIRECPVLKERIGNGEYIPMMGKGTVAIESQTGLKLIFDVLFVSDIDQNLLNVGQLVEKGFKVYFEDRNCIIKDAKGKEVFNIKMKGKSFALNLLEDEHVVVLKQDSTTMFWHRRLGHFHHDVVLYMKKNQIV
ncbi:putative disease resistance protein [Vitis vinifera]|uniref:Putative disease resistance protein n=1 Tax=Vitis vinifera TaxID=29760 RepID=A0A438I7Q9_VITVI|nr:putative disease resistance protein [Vitis vinifera]